MSWQRRLLTAALRRIEKPRLARLRHPDEIRPTVELITRHGLKVPPLLTMTEDCVGGVPGLWVSNSRVRARAVLLYLHGGAYLLGSSRSHRALAGRISIAAGVRVFLPDYRLGPEDPFPGAVEDAEAAYDGLRRLGYPAEEIILGGDSAGGGLAFALLGRLLALGRSVPAGCFGLSPWTDLTLSGETVSTNAEAELWLPPSQLAQTADFYLGGADAADPRASPLFADFAGAPPVLLHVGGEEILLADSTRLAARMREQGAEVTLDVRPGLPHAWHLFHDRLPEADRAILLLAEWIKDRLEPG